MSIENDLFTALKTLVGNRVAPNEFPQPPIVPVWPAIRYTFVDNIPEHDICGDGDDTTATPRIQLDVVATTYAAARALRLQVMAAMRSFTPPAMLENSSGFYDEETKTQREVLQYTIHGSSS